MHFVKIFRTISKGDDLKMMKSLKLEHKNRKLLFKTLKELKENGQIEKEKHFFQHGMTTVFDHSVQVASTSLVFS